MKQTVHMKTVVGPNGKTAPLCDQSAWRLVTSYNWASVTCQNCLAQRKKKT